MLRRSLLRRTINADLPTGPTWRGLPTRDLIGDVLKSPYKDSFRDYWSTPLPWIPREYGPKPKLGEPVPARAAATVLVVGKNNHVDPKLVESGEENDYKVLMMHKEAKGRYRKDQFVLAGGVQHIADTDEGWDEQLERLGLKTKFADRSRRLCALRRLLVDFNLLVIPPQGGGLAEVEGPPGPRRWHTGVGVQPSTMRRLIDVLEMPMEDVLGSLLPFRRIVTPTSEKFRFDNHCYIVSHPKIAEVKYTLSMVGELLVWISPKEAIRRFNEGQLETPTANIILMAELDQQFSRWSEIEKQLTKHTDPPVIVPELVHDPTTHMATVLLPGDVHYSDQESFPEGSTPHLRRFQYTKDEPYGVRAVYEDHAATSSDDLRRLEAIPARLVEEGDSYDKEVAVETRAPSVQGNALFEKQPQ